MGRYMELIEFAVMLIQAPAQSVVKSVIYARQNLVRPRGEEALGAC